MKFIKHTKKLHTISSLCEHKRAGTPQQLRNAARQYT
jgi:hypothetical protein